VVASIGVPTGQLASSDGPLLEVTGRGPLAVPDKVFSAIALFALANGALINLIMASRLLYGMAGEGVVPPIFGRVHAGRRTPWVAIVFTTAIAGVLVLSGDISDLADTTVLLLLAVFATVNVSALVLRRQPVDHDHFRAPTVMPVIGFVVCLALMTTKDADTFLRAGLLVGIGALLWLVSSAASTLREE
jgi:amino acid transporter